LIAAQGHKAGVIKYVGSSADIFSMKLRVLLLIALSGIAAQFAIADTIQFLGVPTGVNDGQYYDLPYQIAIDGAADLVACYDIFDDVNFGDIWQANLLTLAEAAASGYFSMDANALAGYERVAWLDTPSGMCSAPPGPPPMQ
jgi:hypothetical protein